MKTIAGFDYRTDKPVEKTSREWKEEVRAAVAAGGIRKIVEGETLVTLPVTENLGAPWFNRTTQVLAFEIYANVNA